MKFSFVPQTFFRIFFFFWIRIRIICRIRISLWNSLENVILYMLKISTKFGVAPQSFCENQNSVQNQNQDKDHDITLDFNTRPTFHTWKTPTKFCLDPLTPSKVIVSIWKVHVRTYVHPDRQTDRRDFFQNFFLIIFFPNFFFKICFLQFFFQNFFPTSLQNLFFMGFTLDALPFTETKRTLCICVMKNMIYGPS